MCCVLLRTFPNSQSNNHVTLTCSAFWNYFGTHYSHILDNTIIYIITFITSKIVLHTAAEECKILLVSSLLFC